MNTEQITAQLPKVPAGEPLEILRTRKAAKALDVSITTFWRYSKTPGFPVAFQLGPNAIGWAKSELMAWLATRRVGA